jgi:hypothetical protein
VSAALRPTGLHREGSPGFEPGTQARKAPSSARLSFTIPTSFYCAWSEEVLTLRPAVPSARSPLGRVVHRDSETYRPKMTASLLGP